jgi:RND family efflux transporter MFP subunit
MTTQTCRSLVASLLVIAVAACGDRSHDPDASPASMPPLKAPVATASVRSIAEPLETGGVVAADLSAALTSRLVATVTNVRVRAGDRVRTGDVLVVLDDRDVAARTREAEALVSAARQGLAVATGDHAAAVAEQNSATASHARIASLHARRSATTQEREDAEARLSSATARVDAASARIEQATSQVMAAGAVADAATATQSFGTIRAPFDGVVTERLTDPGDLASPGAPLLRIESLGAPHVEVQVDEARERYARVGDRVEVLFDDGFGAAATPRPVEGVVTEAARVSADERTFTVKVALPRGSAPRSGTFARVRFRGPSRQALLIPATATRRQGQLVSVFVVEGGVARLRLLRTGYEDPGEVEVLAGLDAGEVIVTAPPPALVDGTRVIAQGSPTAGAPR